MTCVALPKMHQSYSSPHDSQQHLDQQTVSPQRLAKTMFEQSPAQVLQAKQHAVHLQQGPTFNSFNVQAHNVAAGSSRQAKTAGTALGKRKLPQGNSPVTSSGGPAGQPPQPKSVQHQGLAGAAPKQQVPSSAVPASNRSARATPGSQSKLQRLRGRPQASTATRTAIPPAVTGPLAPLAALVPTSKPSGAQATKATTGMLPVFPGAFAQGMISSMFMTPGLLPQTQLAMANLHAAKQKQPQVPPVPAHTAILNLLGSQLKLKQQQEKLRDVQSSIAAAAAAQPAAQGPRHAAGMQLPQMQATPQLHSRPASKKAKTQPERARSVKVVTCYQDLYDLSSNDETSESDNDDDLQILQPPVFTPQAVLSSAISPTAAAAAAVASQQAAAKRQAAVAAVMAANKAARAVTILQGMPGSLGKQHPTGPAALNSRKKRGSPKRKRQPGPPQQQTPSRFAREAATHHSSVTVDPLQHIPAGQHAVHHTAGAAAAWGAPAGARQVRRDLLHPMVLQPPRLQTSSLDALAAAAAAASEELDSMSADTGNNSSPSRDEQPAAAAAGNGGAVDEAARSAAEIAAELQEAVKLLLQGQAQQH